MRKRTGPGRGASRDQGQAVLTAPTNTRERRGLTMYVHVDPAQGNTASHRGPVPPATKFQVGDRVRPSDRDNIGTIVEHLGPGRYRVGFVGPGGEAEKDFDEADLKPLEGAEG